jgi:circadian clock protein KaiB
LAWTCFQAINEQAEAMNHPSSGRLEPGSPPAETRLQLRLFVAGLTPRSKLAIQTLRRLCEERIDGNYRLEIVDISQQPALARQEQIIATPTLIKLTPRPRKILVGDFSQTARLLTGLGLAEG